MDVVKAFASHKVATRSAASRETFDAFLESRLQHVLESAPNVRVNDREVRVTGPIRIGTPPKPPAACRLGDNTYRAPVFGNVVDAGDGHILGESRLFEIPIVLGCMACVTHGADSATRAHLGECVSDEGGYFILNGTERAVAFTQTLAADAEFDNADGASFSTLGGRCVIESDDFTVDPRRPVRDVLYTCSLQTLKSEQSTQSPVATTIRYFRACSDASIAHLVACCGTRLDETLTSRDLYASLLHAHHPTNTTGVTEPTGSLSKACECVPGPDDDTRAATIAYALATALEIRRDVRPRGRDQDELGNVRLVGAATRFESWIRDRWTDHISKVSDISDISDMSDIFDDDMLPELCRCLDHPSTLESSSTPSFKLRRSTPHGAVACVSRILRPNTTRSTGPRPVHASQYGFVCPVETPDDTVSSEYTGSLACMATVSTHATSDDKITTMNIVEGSKTTLTVSAAMETFVDPRTVTPVLMDGAVVAFTRDAPTLTRELRSARRLGKFSPTHSVAWTLGDPVRVSTSAGRLVRPLLSTESVRTRSPSKLGNDSSSLDWVNMLRPDPTNGNPRVEYVDVRECSCAMIAPVSTSVDVDSTHVEIHPTAMLASTANLLPLSNHNCAERNAIAARVSETCSSVYASNFRYRADDGPRVLHGGQFPLVDTAWSIVHETRTLPYGVNAVVAVCTMQGYTQSDAVVLNGASLDRGMFASTRVATFVLELGPGEVLCDPSTKSVRARCTPESYTRLGRDGLPMTGSILRESSPIVGRVTRSGGQLVDTSVTAGSKYSGTVSRTSIVLGDDGVTRAKVTTLSQLRPETGDTFSSRSGQTGVCARVVAAEDMPYTRDGLVPDMVINPHAFPSRMTLAQFLELALAKATCFDGDPLDATSFVGPHPHTVSDRLEPYAEMWGSDVMFDPRTGRAHECDVTVGPTFYMQANRAISDEIYADRYADRDVSTGQPVDRAGVRFGEPERDSILAHGMSQFLQESYTLRSDGVACRPVTFVNGYPEVPDRTTHMVAVRGDPDTADIVTANPPRAFTLMQAELRALGVSANPSEPDPANHFTNRRET